MRASFALSIGLAIAGGAYAQKPKPTVAVSGLTVSVSGSPVEFSGAGPVMQGESVLVPFRAVLEKLGSTVAYDSASKQIDAATTKYKVRLTPGSTAARVNDRDINMSVAPKLIGGTVYIPLRFVSESLGAKVQYDATAKTVQITPGPETAAGSATGTETQAMNETNTTTSQTPPDAGNTPMNSPDAGNMGVNAGNVTSDTDANATNATPNAPTGTTETNVANTGENTANIAPTENAADANTAPVAPTSSSTTTTAPATSESVETPSSIPWLPILGVLAALIIAAIVYFALNGRRSGQIIASDSDSKKS